MGTNDYLVSLSLSHVADDMTVTVACEYSVLTSVSIQVKNFFLAISLAFRC